jgi:hypothetical protein
MRLGHQRIALRVSASASLRSAALAPRRPRPRSRPPSPSSVVASLPCASASRAATDAALRPAPLRAKRKYSSRNGRDSPWSSDGSRSGRPLKIWFSMCSSSAAGAGWPAAAAMPPAEGDAADEGCGFGWPSAPRAALLALATAGERAGCAELRAHAPALDCDGLPKGRRLRLSGVDGAAAARRAQQARLARRRCPLPAGTQRRQLGVRARSVGGGCTRSKQRTSDGGGSCVRRRR